MTSKRELRINFWKSFGDWTLLVDLFEERQHYWEDELQCLSEETRNLIAPALAGLDTKAFQDHIEYGENYINIPKIDTLTALALHSSLTIEKGALLLEAATLVWAGISDLNSISEEFEVNIEDLDIIVNLTYLDAFWDSKRETKESIRQKSINHEQIVSMEQLREWLRYSGGERISIVWKDHFDKNGKVILPKYRKVE